MPFVASTAVTAKPFTAPLSASVKLVTSADTSAPELLPSATSSAIVGSVLVAPAAVSTQTCNFQPVEPRPLALVQSGCPEG